MFRKEILWVPSSLTPQTPITGQVPWYLPTLEVVTCMAPSLAQQDEDEDGLTLRKALPSILASVRGIHPVKTPTSRKGGSSCYGWESARSHPCCLIEPSAQTRPVDELELVPSHSVQVSCRAEHYHWWWQAGTTVHWYSAPISRGYSSCSGWHSAVPRYLSSACGLSATGTSAKARKSITLHGRYFKHHPAMLAPGGQDLSWAAG